MNRKIKGWRISRNCAARVIERSPFKISVWISTSVIEGIHMPYLRERWYRAKSRRGE